MCNTKEEKAAQECIIFVLFNGKWFKDINVFCVSLFY
jgi:hypothetical protein